MSTSTAEPGEKSVCVIIAAYNASEMIAKAVASALAQPEAGAVVVVDDGSTDDTLDFARGADDHSGRLQVVALPRNGGPSAARNFALDRTTLPFICVLDADDVMLPGRLKRLVEEAADDFDFVADDILLCRMDSADIVGRLLDGCDALPCTLNFVDFVKGNLPRPGISHKEYGFLKPLIRREFLIRSGLKYDEVLRLGEDFILYAKALARGARFRLLDEAFYVAGALPNSLSRRHRTEDIAAFLAAERRLLEEQDISPEGRRMLRRHARHTWMRYMHRKLLDAKNRYSMTQTAARSMKDLYEVTTTSLSKLAAGFKK